MLDFPAVVQELLQISFNVNGAPVESTFPGVRPAHHSHDQKLFVVLFPPFCLHGHGHNF